MSPLAARSRRPWPWLWLAVGVLAVAAACVPAHAITHVTPIAGRRWFGNARQHAGHELFVDLTAWAVLFAVAVAALLRAPRTASVATSCIGGIALSVASLAKVATLSNDFYRYVWDGRVQAAGIVPYRYVPVSPHLARLHDSWLWPSAAGCAARGKPPGCTLINRETVHTVYPPGAQLVFLVEHWLVPTGLRDRSYELVGLGLAALVAALLLRILATHGRDIRLVALWTLCPAVALEAVQNAHVDVVATVAAVAAVGVARRRTLLAAALLAVATLVKFYPLVLFPAVIVRRRVLAGALVVAVVVLAYLPYVVTIGSGVSGYLHGYLSQEGYGSGNRFVLLSALGVHGPAATAIAVVLVASVVVAALLHRLGPPDRAALAVFTTVLLVATPGEPWYDLLLVALVALTGAWQWLGVIVGDYVGYLTTLLGGHTVDRLAVVYAVALAVGVVVTVLRHRRAPTRAVPADAAAAS